MTALPTPFPFIPLFLGLGFAVLCTILCTIFCVICKICRHRRERKREREREQERAREREIAMEWDREQERETWRSSEQDWQPPSIYFMHFSRTTSLPDEEDHYRQEPSAPPQYSNAVHCEPPPAYNELACKPDDLPPPYAVYNIPVYPVSPPSYTDTRQSHRGCVKHVTFSV